MRARHWIAMLGIAGLLTALLLALVLRLPARAVRAQGGPAVRVARGELTQQAITVALAAEGMNNLGGFEFDLGVDPAVARLVGAHLGDFLAFSGRTTGALGPRLGAQGESLAFGGYSYDPSGGNRPGPAGDGVLAQVRLQAAGEGVSELTLSNPLLVDVEANVQPATARGATLQVKRLHGGWNLLAPCVDTAGLTVPEVLASLAGSFDKVLGERGAYAIGLPPESQSLDEVAPPWSYYVRVTAGGSVTLTQVASAYAPGTAIPLSAGWRWVGYCVGSSLPITMALGSIEGRYDMVLGERGAYVVGLPDEFQSLRQTDQGAGYLIRMTADGVLTYPAGGPAGAGAGEPRGRGAAEPGCGAQPSPYVTLAYGQVLVGGQPALAGALVEAMTPRGDVAGCAVVMEGGAFPLMLLYGADEDGRTPGFRAEEPIAWRVDGWEAAGPALAWADDKAVHQVRLEVAVGSPTLYLPLIMR